MDSGVYMTWGGVASCSLSAVLYLFARHEGKKAKVLEAARPVDSVADIMQLVGLIPLLIAIRGKAASDDPVQAEITGTSSVLAEVTEELSALKQNDKGDWLPDSQLIRKQKWETNWFLTDPTKSKVHVENSLGADLLRGTMLVTAQEYREGNRSMYSKLVDRLTGYRPLGVRKTERVLPVDAVVTVVGELAHSLEDDQHRLVIRRPQTDGGPFYITRQTFEGLHASLSRVATTCKLLAMGFGILGVAMLGSQAYKRVKAHVRYRQIRKQFEEDERRRRQRQMNGEDVADVIDEGQQAGKCIVCWDNPANAVFIPCGHLCICLSCSAHGTLNRCPVCRKRSTVHRVYAG
ncbi:hypothetical protein BSKO_06252 [Bryopsis sp. KO-2023]|nr:hypothetical protein BSKO_06252 [Bryopsis sp. KO-2023]